MEKRITDNIEQLKVILPDYINEAVNYYGHTDELIEIVLDLGRIPTARYLTAEVALADTDVTHEDLDIIIQGIGDFDADNRAGLERTLHRISAIRNRRNEIVGLTCRIGRAVYGTIDIIDDLVLSGKSILMMGPPGVGKTTLLREAARVLAQTKRVVIVDTSNEIGGDGDVPHPAVGRARRMQVSHPERQHEVMIEAVENHNPQVIVIDEIGRELEAMAARTIAERGVQLIGTAHGNTLENLMLNPTLSDLVGGIESVTLSDDEARRRKTQKTVLERRSPPTFEVLVEIQARDHLIVHSEVADAVDGILRGQPEDVEIRTRDKEGHLTIETMRPELMTRASNHRQKERRPSSHENGRHNGNGNGNGSTVNMVKGNRANQDAVDIDEAVRMKILQPINVYAYGVARNRLIQSAKRLQVPANIVDDFGKADVVVTSKSYYRRRPRVITDAERRGMPIYVLRANTVSQTENFLGDLFKLNLKNQPDPFDDAMQEVETAIMTIHSGNQEFVDLRPQEITIRKQQHHIAKKAQLASESYGKEPNRFVRISREGA